MITLVMLCNNNDAQANDEEKILLANLGKLNLNKVKISCSSKAQAKMNKGRWLNQHKMYAKAEKTYLSMIEQFPNCAMAHWGYAVTLLQPRWSNTISQANLIKGSAALRMAASLTAKSKREQDQINRANRLAIQLSNIKRNNEYIVSTSSKK